MSKVLTLNHFLFGTRVGGLLLSGPGIGRLEHGLDGILTDCEMPELDASFDKADAVTSLVSSGFLCLI